MASPLKFLIIDDNSDSRYLLVKTLLRKFPDAELLECESGSVALSLAQNEKPAAIVAHRAEELNGPALVSELRKAHPVTPIVMVSGYDRSKEAAAAGATAFLNYNEWLRVGTLVRELLANQQTEASPPADGVGSA